MPDISMWKDLPYFIAGGLILWGLFRSLASTILKLAEYWKEVSQKRNEVDSKRNEIEERSMNTILKVAEMLEALSKRYTETEKLLHQHNESFTTHSAQQAEIKQSIVELQTTLNNLIEYSKSCPQLTDQIKTGFEDLSLALKEIKELVNGDKHDV